MSEAHPEIVIVRRRGSSEDEPHGGAWKIAFADFMTAMMAFFLVLWIISATDKNTKTVIARYFNPVKVEEPAKAQKGIHGAPEQDTDAPGKSSGAPNAEKPRSDQGDAPTGPVHESSVAPSNDAKSKHLAKPEPKTPPDPAKPNPTMSEAELFSDPSASLDKIAGSPPPGPRIDPSASLKGYGEVGPSADEAFRDPFRPLGAGRPPGLRGALRERAGVRAAKRARDRIAARANRGGGQARTCQARASQAGACAGLLAAEQGGERNAGRQGAGRKGAGRKGVRRGRRQRAPRRCAAG
jgi:chemotaxis protein MotB